MAFSSESTHQVVVDALQVGLLQLHVDVLGDQVYCHIVLVPAQHTML